MASVKIKLIIILLISVVLAASANEKSDSIRKRLPELDGAHLLDALASLCSYAHAGNDMEAELRAINAYLDEAIRQRDSEAIGTATISRLNCFLNYDCNDSIEKYLPDALSEMHRLNEQDFLYNCWNVAVQNHHYHNRLESALAETRRMYDYARNNNSDYGKGVALYNIGTIYQAMGRLTESTDALEKSVEALKSQPDITMLLSAYNYLCAALDGLGRHDRIPAIATEWKDVIDAYEKKAIEQGYSVSLGGKRLYNELAFCIGEMGLGNMQAAEKHLALAQKHAEGRSASAQYRLKLVESRYYSAVGDYDRAIRAGNENVDMLRQAGDSVSLATTETMLADILYQAGRFQEAATIYNRIIPVNEKIRTDELSHQLDELRTLHEVDTLRLKAEAAHSRLLLSIGIGILILIILVLTAVHSLILKRKNLVLYDMIQQRSLINDSVPDAGEADCDEKPKEQSVLFSKVTELMEQDRLYTDPHLNREMLAAAANSNTVYLANEIKKHTGMTVNEFITDYRITHASRILSDNPDTSIGEVETLSGFNSRSTFSRLFRQHFGMSPSEYRAASKSKKS